MSYTSTFQKAKMFPANHKTIFVLDHTPYFGISCESPIEFDFLKTRSSSNNKAPNVISKSLWTCSVESAIEYCRIVWDLFPHGKLIRFIASDTVAHILNTWNPAQQNLNHIMNGMSLIGFPPPPPIRSVQQPGLDFTVLHGLRAAIEALSELTDLQRDKKNLEDGQNLINNCRVICITSARDNDCMKRLEEIFQNVLQQQNKMAASSDRFLPIHHCHLVIINTFPISIESQVSNHSVRHLSPNLKTEVHSIIAPLISNKLSSLILDQYDLASTTVTGIPMKEEQNASSSANYDVEIYHSKDAHVGMLGGSDNVRTIKEGSEYETITLKWCTPRGSATTEMQNCTSMHRITPVDVNSRPSLCLINFLLNGRSVMLEMPRKGGGKIGSHLLASHGGEIFIHTLCTARSVLEDPPSISEGLGGRVTDYRITDLGALMQQNKLVPVRGGRFHQSNVYTVNKMKMRLARHTKYWPLTISSTLIFNLKNYIEPLPSIITKERVTEEELIQCKQVIYNLISLEAKHENLHVPTSSGGQRSKGSQKRDEQYKIMWNELETLLKNNCHSDEHRAIYNCLIECHKFSNHEDVSISTIGGTGFVDSLSKSDGEIQRVSVIRATTDSPMSPPPLTSITGSPVSYRKGCGNYVGGKSLCEIFEEKTKRRQDFAGRVATPGNGIAKLYHNLKIENDRFRNNENIIEVIE